MKKKFRIVYLVLFLSTIFIQAQLGLTRDDKSETKSSEKIAVATVGDSETSNISNKTGRAPYFLIFDCSGVFVKAIKNPAQSQRGGASSSVTALLKKESVKTLIAVRFGTKMVRKLKAAGIEYREHSGVAREVVETMIKSKRSKDAHK